MTMKKIIILTVFIAAVIMLIPSNLSAQKNKTNGTIPLYKTIYPSSFFTINAEYIGGYRPDQFFNPQTPAFGFKAGTMRNVGWYVSAMTNFKFKGTFTTCEASDILEGSTSTSYFDVLGGITLRYWKPLSFHLGLGYTYRSFNNETTYGQWAHIPNHIAQGPTAAAGFMLHLGGFVISAEVLGNYNVQGLNKFDYHVDKTRFSFGAKAGIGICIPYNTQTLYQDNILPKNTRDTVYYKIIPAAQDPTQVQAPFVVNTPAAVPAQTANVSTHTEPQVMAKPETTTASSALSTKRQQFVVTMPITQLFPGGITISGEVLDSDDEPVVERGICWGKTPYPSVTGQHTSDGSGVGYFTTTVSHLEPNTIYYFRAYAGTQSGIRYGNVVSVTLPPANTQPLQSAPAPQMPAPPQAPAVAPQAPAPPQAPAVAPQVPAPPQAPAVAPQVPTPPQEPVVAPQVPVPPQEPAVAPQVPTPTQAPAVAPQVPTPPQEPAVAPQAPTPPQAPVAAPQVPTPPQEPVVAPQAPTPPDTLSKPTE